MNNLLYQYILVQQQISLPGVGTIQLIRNAASLNIADRKFQSPYYQFTFDATKDVPEDYLYQWLADSMKIETWDAVKKLNEFSANLKEVIADKGEYGWNKIGLLRRDEKGAIVLEGDEKNSQQTDAVAANKVIRQHQEHAIRVGEFEKSSSEMESILATKPSRVNYSWYTAILIVISSLVFISWHFSNKKITTNSVGNQVKYQKK